MTTDRSDPPTESPARRRRWPRVSLRVWLLLLVIVALVISNLATSLELNRTRTELGQLRVEAGYLTIDDPGKIHVLNVPELEPDTWKWRVYLPPGRRYTLYRGVGNISRDDLNASTASSEIKPGEHFLTARVICDRKDGLGLITRSSVDGVGRVGFAGEDAEKMGVFREGAGWETSGCIRLSLQQFDWSKPVVLLRYRMIETTGTKNPTPGVLLWITSEPETKGP